MSLKMTRNDIRDEFSNVIMLDYIQYCELQSGLAALPKIGYNAGLYGWNYNVYVNPSPLAAIVAGYKPAGGNIIPSSELVEKTAELLSDNRRAPKQVMAEFVREALGFNK